MATPNHTLPSPDISDVMSLLNTIKKENDEAMKEILTKLKSIEDDNRKLRQELHEIKSYQSQRHTIMVSSKKRDGPEDDDKAENRNEQSNSIKRARVSVSTPSLPDLELGSASFDTLNDDCLGKVLEFVGKKSYSVFGRVNKRCHEMFCSKGYPKETYLYGYAPFHIILQQHDRWDYCDGLSIGALHYNRRDIFEWMLADESEDGYSRLDWLCDDAIEESRLDILREVFRRVNRKQLKYLRKDEVHQNQWRYLSEAAVEHGKLECLKFLRENECGWDKDLYYYAKEKGHEHILEYLRNNGYPAEWQISESEWERDYV